VKRVGKTIARQAVAGARAGAEFVTDQVDRVF